MLLFVFVLFLGGARGDSTWEENGEYLLPLDDCRWLPWVAPICRAMSGRPGSG